jgi:hypothetical protein
MIELIQQLEVLSILLNRTRPEFMYNDYGLGAPLTPLTNTGEFDKALGAPSYVHKKLVICVHVNRHDRRRVLQTQSFANATYESVEVALDTMVIMLRQNAPQIVMYIIVNWRCDQISIFTLRYDLTELIR